MQQATTGAIQGKYLVALLFLVLFVGRALLVSNTIVRDLVGAASTTSGAGDSDDNAIVDKPKIAILLSYVPSGMWGDRRRIGNLDMIINKVCYANLWGYDVIVNTTNYFADYDKKKQHWLEWGAWNRVPHLQSALEAGYDWVFYADIDLMIRDQVRPLESIFKELELYNLNEASVLVGSDAPGEDGFIFSSFGVLMKNTNFTKRVLHYWMEAANGLCPNGNFRRSKPGKYHWEGSDQPGMWYAFMKAHNELPGQVHDPSIGACDNATGLLVRENGGLEQVNEYFAAVARKGTSGAYLKDVPKDQPILFSAFDKNDKSSQSNGPFAVHLKPSNKFYLRNAFAIHMKHDAADWYGEMPDQLERCKQQQGCFANYSNDGTLHIGCGGVSYYNERP